MSHRFILTLPEPDSSAAHSAAKELGISTAELVRRLLRCHVRDLSSPTTAKAAKARLAQPRSAK